MRSAGQGPTPIRKWKNEPLCLRAQCFGMEKGVGARQGLAQPLPGGLSAWAGGRSAKLVDAFPPFWRAPPAGFGRGLSAKPSAAHGKFIDSYQRSSFLFWKLAHQNAASSNIAIAIAPSSLHILKFHLPKPETDHVHLEIKFVCQPFPRTHQPADEINDRDENVPVAGALQAACTPARSG